MFIPTFPLVRPLLAFKSFSYVRKRPDLGGELVAQAENPRPYRSFGHPGNGTKRFTTQLPIPFGPMDFPEEGDMTGDR